MKTSKYVYRLEVYFTPYIMSRNCSVSHLEGSEPHEPVQPVVVGRYEARSAVDVAWFTQELVLLPNRLRVLGILAQSALEDHLCTLLGNAEERSLYC